MQDRQDEHGDRLTEVDQALNLRCAEDPGGAADISRDGRAPAQESSPARCGRGSLLVVAFSQPDALLNFTSAPQSGIFGSSTNFEPVSLTT